MRQKAPQNLIAPLQLQLTHIYGMRHKRPLSFSAHVWLQLTHIYGMRRKKVTLHLFSEYMLHLTHIYGMRHALMPMNSYRKTHYTNTCELRDICVLR